MSDWPPSSGPGGAPPPPSWGSGPGGPPGPPPGPPPGGFGGPPQGGFGGPPPGQGFGGPPPGPGFGGPPPGFGGPPQGGSNGLAIAGLVLGILAIVTFFVPYAGIVLGLIGLVLSILGRKRANETGVGGGMAITGLILSIIGIIIGIAWVAFTIWLVDTAGDVFGEDFNLCAQGDLEACERLGTTTGDGTSDAGTSPDDLASEGGFDDIFETESPPVTPDATATTTTGSDASSDPVAAEETSVFELEVGDCFDDPESTDAIQTVPVVPCDQPHDNEIIALVDHPGGAADPFPGVEAIETLGDEQCQGEAFSTYVGVEYEFSRYFITTLTPTEGSWAQGDREIVCIVNIPGEELTGSVAGTAE